MTVELLQMLSAISYVLGGFLFIIGIILFFTFKIPKVIGDISGRTARKEIQEIRRQNEEAGHMLYNPSVVNMDRGKITDDIYAGTKVGQTAKHGLFAAETDTIELNEGFAKSDETALLDEDTYTQIYGEYNAEYYVVEEIIYVHTEEIIL